MGTTKGALARDLAIAVKAEPVDGIHTGFVKGTADLNDLVGHEFVDASGRRLTVEAVDPGAPNGLEIIGGINNADSLLLLPYATDQRTFKAIWLEQEPVAKHQRGY
jgi:hypothetical protein